MMLLILPCTVAGFSFTENAVSARLAIASIKGARSMETIFPYRAEPGLEEVMNDPMIRRLMQKDGIEDGNMAPLLKETMRRLHIEPMTQEAAA